MYNFHDIIRRCSIHDYEMRMTHLRACYIHWLTHEIPFQLEKQA